MYSIAVLAKSRFNAVGAKAEEPPVGVAVAADAEVVDDAVGVDVIVEDIAKIMPLDVAAV